MSNFKTLKVVEMASSQVVSNINVQKFEAALRAFDIPFDHNRMNAMFSAKKSYLTCRDGILHGLKKASIDEVLTYYDEMQTTMKDFLGCVAKAEPKK